MHKFVFKLQTKLNISVRQEQLAIEQLALKVQERNIIADDIVAKQIRLDFFENNIRKSSYEKAKIFIEYIPIIRKDIKDLEKRLAEAEDRVEIARNILLECKKETKTLNKLRENEWQRYLHEFSLEEQKAIDEMAINNHFRNNLS
ncbi:MAG TPA: flagellar export protein FliJ [Syntrophomonadaceae bacterium]|nr:flagellar export protein FliJ [Syntrophomonadaceae bacterium]